MSPISHILIGWLTANIPENMSHRDRALITIAGAIPDIDGIGIIAELPTRDSAHPLLWYYEYHHMLHNIGFCLLVCMTAYGLSNRRILTSLLVFLSFHLHLLCDIVGSRGPDGSHWPIPYLLPFSDSLQLEWEGQWELNAWPNILITACCLLLIFWLARRRGYSPLSLVSKYYDKGFVNTLRKRFPYHDTKY